jgi:glycosyltransferase involved in cell wall biosynthesis
VRVYLSTEGTYPFVVGGVSTWADLLVRGLPQYRFHVAAVVDNPFHPLSFRLPPNVGLQPVPLWGSEMAEEYLVVPGSWRRAWRTSSTEVRRRFLPCWEPFADSLAMQEVPAAALGDTLADVARFAERYDLRRALASRLAWAVLLDRVRANALMARSTALGAIEFGRALFRFLLPLCAPIPRCDVAHTSAAGLCALPAVVAKYRYGTPLVLTEHGIYLRERILALSDKPLEDKFLHLNFFRAVTELAYREADILAPVCGYNAGWENALGVDRRRIRVIHNGLPGGALASLNPEAPPGPPTVGFIGRIDPLKDVVTLIRAFSLVRRAVPDARLRIWGPASSDEYLRHCKRVASSLHLMGSGPSGTHAAVSFEGRTSDLPAAYGACHVMALSSVTEGFPYTVVESMLAARPVVATSVGGVSEALGDIGVGARHRREDYAGSPEARSPHAGSPDLSSNGDHGLPIGSPGAATRLLVDPGDPQSLARALVGVLLAPETERMAAGLALRSRALERFNVSGFLHGYSQVYEGLAGPQPVQLAGAS